MSDSTWRIHHGARIANGTGRKVRARLAAHLAARLANGFRLFAAWRERARQRRALAELDDRQLRDIGITHVDARRESDKPFWR